MAVLSAVFKAVDQLSDVLDRMSEAGATALERWERSAGAANDALSRAADGAERAGQAASDAADRVESAQDRLDRLGEEADDAADQIDRLNGEVDNAGDHLDDLRDHLDEAGDDLDDFGDDADDAGNDSERFGERASNALQTVSNILASAGIIKGVQELASAFLEASNAAAAFETATMKVSTIADTNAVSLDTLANGVMDMSLDTGQAVGDLSEALYSALSASVDTANSVQFTGTAVKLATGGFTSSATAVDVLTTALNAYGLEADKAGSISDMLITTQNLGKTTVDELAASVGKVIPLASAYGVEMDNLSAAYAELTKGGIATAEAGTYLKGMLRELGDSGSTVSKTLIEETGYSFAQLMSQGHSLGDVLDVLGETVGGDAGAFNELWSSAEAGLGALALYNAGAEQFNTTLDAMQNSLGATETAYTTMTDTTAHAKEEMQNAAANLQIVIGQNLNPAIEKLYGIGTSALTVATKFAQDHPIVVKALAAVAVGVGAVAVGVGAVAVGIAGFTFVTQVAIPAITSFGVALNAALGPIGWVALGITGIVAAGAALIAMFQEEETEYDTWTASTKKQYDALQDLNGEYERAVETYGATSEEASRLRYQIDDLNAEFEASKMTVEEFTAKCDALASSHEELAQSYAESTASIDAEEVGTLALIQKLNDLASSSEQTAATQMQMQSIVDDLSQSFPGLGLSIENVTQNTDAMVAALKKAAEEQANQERYQENYDTYVSLLKEQAQIEEQIAAAEENIRLEQERLDGMSGWDQFWSGTDDLEAYQAALEELQAAQADNLAMQSQCEQAMQDYANAAAEAADASISYEDAVSNAITAVSDDLSELAEKYQEAYGAALESVQGQYALWDEAAEVTVTSAGSINSALESQISYWEAYNSNLAGLTERSADIEGLSDMIASFADGSSDSVNAVAGMASATDEELAAMVANWQSLQDVQGTTADSLAQLETDFNDSLASIEERMNAAVDNMNMDTEAASAAKATIDAYIANIRAGTTEAGNAAEAVAAATAKALAGNSSGVTGYATGTTYAEPGVHIVGEEGPEAIFFRGGETVLDSDDTRQYLAGQRPLQTSVPDVTDAQDSGPNGNGGERRIVLELAGRGSLELYGSNFDPDTAAEWLADNLRPLLISTLKQEILEEGDGSRDF